MSGGFNCFLGVAVRKLNSLIFRDDFLAIDDVNIEHGEIIILFKASKCKINKFGKVEWSDK